MWSCWGLEIGVEEKDIEVKVVEKLSFLSMEKEVMSLIKFEVVKFKINK